MKKLEKEIEVGVVSTDILRNAKATNFKATFVVNLNLNEKELEIFKTGINRGKIKIVCEVEEPILDDKEREYLRGVIKPFRNKVKYIEKYSGEDKEFIEIMLEDYDRLLLPNFKNGTMYKGMKSSEKYSLKELGL